MAQSKKNGKTNRTGRMAKQKRMPRYEADSLAACLMVGILLLATGILTLLGAGFGLQHEVFRYLRQFSSSMFGSMTLLMTFALIAAGVALLISTTRKVSRRYVASYAILVVLLSGFVSLMTFVTSSEGQFPLLDYIAQKTGSDAFSGMMSRSMTYGMKGYGGGMVGMLLAWPLWKFFGAGLGAVILGLLMAVDVLVGGWSLFRRLYGWTGEKLVQLREKQAKRAEEAGTSAAAGGRTGADSPRECSERGLYAEYPVALRPSRNGEGARRQPVYAVSECPCAARDAAESAGAEAADAAGQACSARNEPEEQQDWFCAVGGGAGTDRLCR